MHLNMKLAKSQYKGQRAQVVGKTTKEFQREAQVKVKAKKAGFVATIASWFGITLTEERVEVQKWLERINVAKTKAGHSKLGWKLRKSQIREVAKIKRMQEQGIRISLGRLMRTGIPISLRELRGAK